MSKEYGAIIREQRVAAGLSLRDAARILSVTDVEYGEFERGVKQISVEQERALFREIERAGGR